MTKKEVEALVRQQAEAASGVRNHSVELRQLLIAPTQISMIARTVRNGEFLDELISVWLVAQESSSAGYRIVMSADGASFGLASQGFPADEHLILCGWYGDLANTFACM